MALLPGKIFRNTITPAAPPANTLEFDIRARADDARKRLELAANIAANATEVGAKFEHEGYSTGGFSGRIVTASGQIDGPPKMDPVTVAIVDRTGQELFTIAVILKNDTLETPVKGSTPAVQDKINRLPASWAHPTQIIQGVMSALTPDIEIGAAVACVKQGTLVFDQSGLPAARAQARQAQTAADDDRQREAVQDATVLKTSTTVGAPLRLKTPKA